VKRIARLFPEDKGQSDSVTKIKDKLKVPNEERLWYIADAYRAAMTTEEIQALTKIDPWFLHQIQEIVGLEEEISREISILNTHHGATSPKTAALLKKAKEFGFSDARLSDLIGMNEADVRRVRNERGVRAVFKRVDTCNL
jgi:carbamoyl-phosphate synthase large subunit